MFDDLNKNIKEGQERWGEIEELMDSVSKTDWGSNTPIVKLLLLVIEHLRPMNPSQQQIEEATKGLDELLKSLKK